MPRRTLSLLTSLVAAVSAASGGATAARADEQPVRYVALGDSYTAAPLTSFLQPGSPLGCIRGDLDYPTLIAKSLKPASFKDVSCSGAKTGHMTSAQTFSVGDPNPPQFDALTEDTTLVTLTIGGNDIGFSKAVKCFTLSYSAPDGSPCKNSLTADGMDPFQQSIAKAAPDVGRTLAGIHERSPKAKVYLLLYPLILPAEGSGCFPWVPIAKGDVPYLRGVQSQLNAMLTDEAAKNGVTVVDTTEPGHDTCQPDASKRWIEGVPTQWAAPAHPNQNGERAMAALTLAAYRTAASTAR
ncbi:SGNH/GDSL hydrolase family protein [Actinomadura rayongensis]|uniref:SGNH/GDSL hydrolase family protein n=2 Tax=Actinomadura rayongensis TaxID=1429076 RepID=A0A6I4W7J0_9ACTN|nr:SGNH/GDSL hydrolase family protein [Actinomadura rayongensis]MXQ65441.1 SGNH/GDSL hydrolase family protein [Actinomadura rayongensis]